MRTNTSLSRDSTNRHRVFPFALAALLAAACLMATSCATAPVVKAPEAAPKVETAAQALPEDVAVSWNEDAKAAFEKEVPKAVQKIAKKSAEKKARERGIAVIDMAFYIALKAEMGM
jgi:hypothetical protein